MHTHLLLWLELPTDAEVCPDMLQSLVPKEGLNTYSYEDCKLSGNLLGTMQTEVGILTFCPNILPYKLVCNTNTWSTFSSATILEVSNRISTIILVFSLRQFTDYCPAHVLSFFNHHYTALLRVPLPLS